MPKRIYLQVGDECPHDVDFNELSDVTWNKDRIHENDVPYIKEAELGKFRKQAITSYCANCDVGRNIRCKSRGNEKCVFITNFINGNR